MFSTRRLLLLAALLYIPVSNTKTTDCPSCSLSKGVKCNWKSECWHYRILIFFSVTAPTPFLSEALGAVADLQADNAISRLELHFVNGTHREEMQRAAFEKHAALVEHKDSESVTLARMAKACNAWNCDFVFYVESHVHIRHPQLLLDLCRHNRSLLVPFITSADGKLATAQSDEYQPQINEQAVRATNRAKNLFLVRKDFFNEQPEGVKTRPLSEGLEQTGFVLYPSANKQFGNLMSLKTFGQPGDRKRHTGELWEMFSNPREWEERYIHKSYAKAISTRSFKQPCPDVFWVPLFSEQFCRDMVDEMEAFGKWSKGSMNTDNIARGVDPRRTEVDFVYATVDIFMWQIRFNYEYLWIMWNYVYPLQQIIFPDHNDYPFTVDNFVARYREGEQVRLASHFDDSHVSLNVALSTYDVDYKGGGTHFVRYDCSLVQTKMGWAIIHPNRPTHRHMGLEIKTGTRYIMVSFFNGTKYVENYGSPDFM